MYYYQIDLDAEALKLNSILNNRVKVNIVFFECDNTLTDPLSIRCLKTCNDLYDTDPTYKFVI